ncbi:hypothetical protein EYC84_005938 [Monilinia fructicola]|uniref:Uncharacterized protein n=1 Tax=Monilinia fructicola TaxID=38448 RepID=A0A5M9K240_MONFR|nr:hypothetical protein EYC84_005938 [Monilinia fructicola]
MDLEAQVQEKASGMLGGGSFLHKSISKLKIEMKKTKLERKEKKRKLLLVHITLDFLPWCFLIKHRIPT